MSNCSGNSLELIASDKSDACAAGGSIVYGENCRKLATHLLEYNRHREIASLFVRDDIGIGGETVSATGQRFDFRFGSWNFQALEMRLHGAFQFNNAAIAVALFLLWLGRVLPKATPAAIESAVRSGLRDTRWPGRLEVIQPDPLTIIDVGHTPDAIRQSLASLKAIHGADDWLLVIGISSDKKADEIAGALAPSFDTIVCTAAHHKGADAAAHRGSGAQGQSACGHSRRRHHRGRRQPQPHTRRLATAENLCRRRIIPRRSNTPPLRAADACRI